MNADNNRLLELAARVSDAREVDWESAERDSSDDGERKIVRRLRLIDGLARSIRDAPGSPSPSDPHQLAATVTCDLRRAGETPLPERWGRLQIIGQLGSGAFGTVYRAHDENLQQDVALKLFDTKRADGLAEPEQLLEEARKLARVRHPNVVTVHTAEMKDGKLAIAMELVHGRTLGDLVAEQGRLGAREAAIIGTDLCRALAAVHGAGLVHRDVKAQNVMRAEGGRIVLMDFGASIDASKEGLTSDRVSGTPLYMSPEVLEGAAATPRSDIFALGVLLYHLVTGGYPVRAPSMAELRDAHRGGRVRLLRDERTDLPESFVSVIEKALHREPAERWGSAGEMERALMASIGGPDVSPSSADTLERDQTRGSRWRIGVVALLIVGAAAIFAGSQWVGWMRSQGADGLSTSTAAATFDIRASVVIERMVNENREPVPAGDALQIGDELTLEIEASTPLYVYVINEDDRGKAFALFPDPDLETVNPLSAGTVHLLPGRLDGAERAWTVTSTGDKERLLVVASQERLVAYEAELALIPRPREGEMAVPLSPASRRTLRGIGGLVRRTDSEARPGRGAAPLFEMAERLAGKTETVNGAWVRQFEMDNP